MHRHRVPGSPHSIVPRVESYLERARVDPRRVLRVSRIEMHRAVLQHVTREQTGSPEAWEHDVGEQGLGRGLWFAALQAFLWKPKASVLAQGRGFARLVSR